MKFNAAKKAVLAAGLFGLSLGVSSAAFSAESADYVDAFEAAAGEDHKKAAAIWFDLAKQGNPDAQFNLALAYHSGVAGSFNEPEALKWYMKAAKSGHQRAQEYLAAGYREGWFGLKKNARKAKYWEEKLNP